MSKSSALPKWSPAELARAAKERFRDLYASTFAKAISDDWWRLFSDDCWPVAIIDDDRDTEGTGEGSNDGECILESNNFELYCIYIASDALATFKFFELSEKLLAFPKYVTRRQSLKIPKIHKQ
ncbi:hypothetical protein ZIOFF_019011 [Zingiber officinale]|uniref:Uncharacterized protein n=1 Tax=Zingiber officinale TaxID=94328 RepID=A0A8J5LNB1_ZINOF|nr:hypothetical protein ZIOFF_019011 [Zingiber officinale]